MVIFIDWTVMNSRYHSFRAVMVFIPVKVSAYLPVAMGFQYSAVVSRVGEVQQMIIFIEGTIMSWRLCSPYDSWPLSLWEYPHFFGGESLSILYSLK